MLIVLHFTHCRCLIAVSGWFYPGWLPSRCSRSSHKRGQKSFSLREQRPLPWKEKLGVSIPLSGSKHTDSKSVFSPDTTLLPPPQTTKEVKSLFRPDEKKSLVWAFHYRDSEIHKECDTIKEFYFGCEWIEYFYDDIVSLTLALFHSWCIFVQF